MKLAGYFIMLSLLLVSCQGSKKKSAYQFPSTQRQSQAPTYQAAYSGGGAVSPDQVVSRLSYEDRMLSRNSRARSNAPSMIPRYITIHSTQNWSNGADAERHALALQRGALGKLCWHFTVDQNHVVQHMPTTEQGKHADIDGPGNHYSIGIEMCEHPGNSRQRTTERAAELTAYLMHEWAVPLSRVVPHYHWPRKGYNPPNKNCPHFLLDNGRPGAKWAAFLRRVDYYYKRMPPGGVRRRF